MNGTTIKRRLSCSNLVARATKTVDSSCANPPLVAFPALPPSVVTRWAQRVGCALPALAFALMLPPLALAQKQSVVKAESVTINMPEGITKDQADAILNELRLIRQLLERQPAAAPQTSPPAAPPSDKVRMNVTEGSFALGRDDAPVTIVEFTDYQCPFCRRFEADTFALLKKDYIDTGKVRFVIRDLPLDFHPNALPAALAVRCAGEQHKFQEMHDTIMRDSTAELSAEAIRKYGQGTGLDMASFDACVKEKKFGPAIQRDIADAGTVGISGTPSFVIGKTAKDAIDGVRIVGAVPYSVFDSSVKELLTK